jgi:hypothetical protein
VDSASIEELLHCRPAKIDWDGHKTINGNRHQYDSHAPLIHKNRALARFTQNLNLLPSLKTYLGKKLFLLSAVLSACMDEISCLRYFSRRRWRQRV